MPDVKPTITDRPSAQDVDDLGLITELSRQAGDIAMGYFGDAPEVWMKEGQSPVTEADYAVDRFLKEKLLTARPDYGWLSEETDDNAERLNTKRVFVVDPIDGTRGFIAGSKQWCVSVAVVENRRPVAGVLDCPALGEVFGAVAGGKASLGDKVINCASSQPGSTLRLTGPRALEKQLDLLARFNTNPIAFVPSLAYRIAMVAHGALDAALARGSAKDWDLAAADLILQQAGGRLCDVDGGVLNYNCMDVRHGALLATHTGRCEELLDLARHAMNNAAAKK